MQSGATPPALERATTDTELANLANLPEESTEGKYTIDKLWNDLEIFINNQAKSAPVEADSTKDEEAYALCKRTMDEFYQLGRQIESLHYIKQARKKAQKGLEAKRLFTERFGQERIPPVEGIKSAKYVEAVILPFIAKSAEVIHERWLKILCHLVRIDLDGEARDAKAAAEKCRQLIGKYIPGQVANDTTVTTTLQRVGQFSRENSRETLTVTVTEAIKIEYGFK